MSKTRRKKLDTAVLVAIIGVMGTVIVGILNSSLLIKMVEQTTAAPTVPPTIAVIPTAVMPTAVPAITQFSITTTDTPIPEGLQQVFKADFEDGSASGFGIESGDWKVEKDQANHVLQGTGTGDITPAAIAIFGPSDFSDGAVEYRIKFKTTSPGSYFDFRLEYNKGSYVLYFDPVGQTVVLATNMRDNNDWQFAEVTPGTTRSFSIQQDTWYKVHLDIKGERLSIKIDGNQIFSASDSRLKQGQMRFTLDPNAIVDFDDVIVWTYR